jgi:hypothetical protein
VALRANMALSGVLLAHIELLSASDFGRLRVVV